MKTCVDTFQKYSINNEISYKNLENFQRDLGFFSNPILDVNTKRFHFFFDYFLKFKYLLLMHQIKCESKYRILHTEWTFGFMTLG